MMVDADLARHSELAAGDTGSRTQNWYSSAV